MYLRKTVKPLDNKSICARVCACVPRAFPLEHGCSRTKLHPNNHIKLTLSKNSGKRNGKWSVNVIERSLTTTTCIKRYEIPAPPPQKKWYTWSCTCNWVKISLFAETVPQCYSTQHRPSLRRNQVMGNVVSGTSTMTSNTTDLPLIFLSRSTIRKKCGRSSGSSHQQSTIRSTNSGLTSTRVKSGRKGGSS